MIAINWTPSRDDGQKVRNERESFGSSEGAVYR